MLSSAYICIKPFFKSYKKSFTVTLPASFVPLKKGDCPLGMIGLQPELISTLLSNISLSKNCRFIIGWNSLAYRLFYTPRLFIPSL